MNIKVIFNSSEIYRYIKFTVRFIAVEFSLKKKLYIFAYEIRAPGQSYEGNEIKVHGILLLHKLYEGAVKTYLWSN